MISFLDNVIGVAHNPNRAIGRVLVVLPFIVIANQNTIAPAIAERCLAHGLTNEPAQIVGLACPELSRRPGTHGRSLKVHEGHDDSRETRLDGAVEQH